MADSLQCLLSLSCEEYRAALDNPYVSDCVELILAEEEVCG
jgi:hypothetical protein